LSDANFIGAVLIQRAWLFVAPRAILYIKSARVKKNKKQKTKNEKKKKAVNYAGVSKLDV